MNIDYDYYRRFYYVAKYRNLSLVAKLLNTNQPNLSKLMNKLEEQMGCKLMIRTNKGIKLTEEGERLYNHVAIAYNELRAAEAELSSENDMSSGMVCIGSTYTALDYVISNILTKFNTLYPNIKISISDNTSEKTQDILKQGLIDFAIVDSPVKENSRFKQTVIERYEEILVTASSSKFSDLKAIRIKKLFTLPVIGFSDYFGASDYHRQFFSEQGLEWSPVIGVTSYPQILSILLKGTGVAFLPNKIAKPYIEKGILNEIKIDKLDLPKREIVLIEDVEQHSSIAARKFISMLKG